MTKPPKWDILIVDGLILTMEDGAPPIWNGFVAIKDGAVAGAGPMTDRPLERGASEIIDASGGVVMPGLVNTHVHGAMTLFRGLADDLPLMTWLEQHIFPAEAAFVDDDLVYWGAKAACGEMLLAGTTTLADGYFYEDATARAVKASGMRAILGQGVLDFPAPGVPDPANNIRAAREFIEQWRDVSPLIRPSVFCHSPYTCSPETLKKGKALAREAGVFLQIHVAETRAEVEQVLSERGLSPVRYLESLGLLDESTLAVHCVHLDDEEVDILARCRTPVSVCVESEMKLASGVAPVPNMLEKGVRVSLGTDGAASNNDLNLFGEIHSLALLYKTARQDPTVLPAAEALRLAGPAGARALGWEGITGTLKPGLRADIIILERRRPNLQPLYNPFSHLVYATTGHEVTTVLVDGRVVVRDRQIMTFDLDETLERVREIAARIAGGGF